MTQIVAVDLADDAQYASFHALYAACYDRPFDQPWAAPEKRVNLTDDAYGRHQVVVALRDGQSIAGGYVSTPLQDNVDVAFVEVFVLPEHRRRGYGTALLDHLVDVARQAGRTRLHGEALWSVDGDGDAGSRFADAKGFTVDLLDAVRELQLPVTNLPQPQPRGGHRLTAWRECPEEWLEQYARLRHLILQEAPSGPVGLENEHWDAERIRHEESRWHGQGRIAQTVVAISPEDRLAGHTQLVAAADGVEVYQWDTLVLPEHRGHGLGLALKLRAMQAAEDLLRGRRRITTWNAANNTHMIAVNEALGFGQTAWAAEYVRHV